MMNGWKALFTFLPLILTALFFGLILTKNVRLYGIKEKAGWRVLCMAALMLFLLSTKPVSSILAYSLERSCRPFSAQDPAACDAVIVLSGGVRPSLSEAEGVALSGVSYARLVGGVRLFKKNRCKTLVLQGASRKDMASDASVMGHLAQELGVPQDQILIEGTSRDTQEHAEALDKLLPPDTFRRLCLVTSAMHMRRARMVFRWQFPEKEILAVCVDDRNRLFPLEAKGLIPSSESLVISERALREWLGIGWYTLRHHMGRALSRCRQKPAAARL